MKIEKSYVELASDYMNKARIAVMEGNESMAKHYITMRNHCFEMSRIFA